METVAIAAVCLAVAGQAWFWYLHAHEQRSLWYGLSFIFDSSSLRVDSTSLR